MKNFKLIVSTLILSSAFLACKKKDATPADVADAKITQIISSSTNNPTKVQTISYDAKNRNTDWTYDGLTMTRNFTVGGRVYKHQYILNNEGLAIEGNSQSTQENFRRRFTYDSQKRITTITLEQQLLNALGAPTTNFKLIYTFDITWDGNSNISSAKVTSLINATPDDLSISYWIHTFEGYSANYPNTLKAANVGLDIFGPQGYPRYVDGSGSSLLFEPLFAGTQVPTKLNIQAYSRNNTVLGDPVVTNYTYDKDEKGRITLFNSTNQSFRFNYK